MGVAGFSLCREAEEGRLRVSQRARCRLRATAFANTCGQNAPLHEFKARYAPVHAASEGVLWTLAVTAPIELKL